MIARVFALASVCLAVASAIPGAGEQASAAAGFDVRYVANSGMLVTMSGRRFLIDAPIREGISPYATSSADERTRLEGAQAPYDRVDAVLITHWHEDHFSPEAAAAHLSSNPRALFISSPEVVDRLRGAAAAVPADRLRNRSSSAACRYACCGCVTIVRAAFPSSTSGSSSAARRRCCTSATPIRRRTTSR
jgi:glyoxylase-like metal-dependent hydrolase (beta-lactamase superfamily II)